MDIVDRLNAEHDWHKARRKVLYQKVVCLLKVCSVDLLSFEEVRSKLQLHQKFYRGLQEVPLDLIRGSVGRFDDFSSAFLPLKEYDQERWQRVDVAMVEGKTPPIDLYQVGQVYFVLDGNHRVSVARQRGYELIEAYVWEFPTPVEFNAEVDLDNILIRAEQTAFLERAGEKNSEAASSIQFTNPGCYKDVSQQIEFYRHGIQGEDEGPLSYSQAFPIWYKEAFLPSVKAIRRNDLLAQFPDRTEADLFIWSWKNSGPIEELVLDDGDPADQA